MFDSVLIANRGEIAVRVARTAHAQGLSAIAVFTDADEGSLHVDVADRAVRICSYLDADAVVEAAVRAGAAAVHPGYGFLSENAEFAAKVSAAGLIWIGPPARAIEVMGDKARAKRLARESGVPVAPGLEGEDLGLEEISGFCAENGYPVVIKAVAGGGGKGMRVVRGESELGRGRGRRPARGPVGLWRQPCARRALPRPAAAYRGAGPRRPARQRRPHR